MLATEVNLPRDHRPVFPDRCVGCGVKRPGATYRLGTHAIGWLTLAFWSFGARFSVEVPACEPCRLRLRRGRWLELAVEAAIVAIGVGVALVVYQGPFKRWMALGVALVCLLPVVLWETFSPRPVDITAYAKTVDYEFRDAGYAAEFAALNRPDPEEPA